MNSSSIHPLIQAVDGADSGASLLAAVEALAAARLEASIPTLIAVLGYNNPGAAVAAVDGLVALGEPAVRPLLDKLDGYNYGARAWAVRALAGIGDPRGLDILVDALQSDFAMSVRRAAARGLGTLHWHRLSPEELEPSQGQALDALLQGTQDPEWIVRYAAVVGLQGLAAALPETQSQRLTEIQIQLQTLAQEDEHLTVQARTWLAQQQLQIATN
ncbi:HEAT repeat domain-containing protein [Synechococcales cyanobacterium C]|uniref:HEAT repeat domain-containing protein n=1 Tax=Petrachloros mirabilis ULC683 TaxID=2781853 RepID=A0A8K2ACI5_9CYAN|nr:HEAT repeat domain-containing protein [Petrachloros mirabilis]NCJ05669.1 HEAT repeat domain-containing protein [Petrachloros mirabilis ULC683]